MALSKLRKTKLLKRKHSPNQLDHCVHYLHVDLKELVECMKADWNEVMADMFFQTWF